MISTHILGFPRMGAERELKAALERHWSGDLDAAGLEAVGRALRSRHWALQRDSGLDFVTVGDFAFYDQVANHIQMLGCEPARFAFTGDEPELTRHFMMARGVALEHGHAGAAARGVPALEMTKWFDTNYHYLVPEFTAATIFRFASQRLIAEIGEAKAQGHRVKVALIGPLTFLWLGKSKHPELDRLDLLDSLLVAYGELLRAVATAGVEWVQIDEPILGIDLPAPWTLAFPRAYHTLQSAPVRLMLATYFSPLEDHLSLACSLPVAALHVDVVRASHELTSIVDWLPPYRDLSVGIVDGRNVWRTDLDRALSTLGDVIQHRGHNLWLASSCSLLHVPMRLADDTSLDPEVGSWLAGAEEKLAELQLLKRALSARDADVEAKLAQSRAAVSNRAASPLVNDAAVATRTSSLGKDADQRRSPFSTRQALQRERLRLPAFPTTTIGSFPQTPRIRTARAAFKRGQSSAADYHQAMQQEIAHAVRKQEELGLDVLVHGEAERNDMVEYFGEQLAGFAFTANGWVQSYGSRCVKPPILFGDVSRPKAMTVDWTAYAQSLTPQIMKGMLTGPITILQWSFVRDDQPRPDTALQIALAIRDEVVDLEAAGIRIIQIDEPAIREGLPLRRSQWAPYLRWAARAFRIAASGVANETQIHTHMCYSEFNDILPEIASMDADVITIETSRSDMELLQGFADFDYPNEIGPGVYDIHSPRVPDREEMVRLLQKAAAVVSPDKLWVNPDCGLKTRGWPETETALRNMVDAARQLRGEKSLGHQPVQSR
jgi:5-methyltetrahydropteroyltriglutamate--homocysteine methyltransferase